MCVLFKTDNLTTSILNDDQCGPSDLIVIPVNLMSSNLTQGILKTQAVGFILSDFILWIRKLLFMHEVMWFWCNANFRLYQKALVRRIYHSVVFLNYCKPIFYSLLIYII